MAAHDFVCLQQYFEAQVARVPNAIAIENPETNERVTYAELDRRVTRLAHLLRAHGIERDEKVGIHLVRGPLVYTTQLATLRAGGAYIPIDEGFPADRVRFMMEDADARVAVVSREFASKFEGSGVEVILADDISFDGGEEPVNDFARPSPEDLCYIIYTSGTTGKPKGCCLSHQNALTFLNAMQLAYGVRETDRVLQGFSTAFDASVEEIWMAFSSGATLVVGSLEMMRAMDELPAHLRELGITVFSTVPTLLGVVDPAELPQLRILIAGGEALRADVVDRWATPTRQLMNSYGPTETTVVCTYSWARPGQQVTIGRPFPGYLAAVLDEAGNEVAQGKEGELCIGGGAVSLRGYLNRPELNAQKFFVRDGVRFYRTGDLVSLNADGNIVYCGRIDAQVKVRGFRVELEEIETHITHSLKSLPTADAFHGAIVALRTDPDAAAELVAFILHREPVDLDVMGLVGKLRTKMPAYMVPSHFVRMQPTAVPRLASGKVDRRALPPLTQCETFGQSAAQDDAVADDTGVPIDELQILKVWRDVLNNRALGRDDSFFDFGGNSILAGQSITQFRTQTDLSLITIRDMYQRATARQLAERLRERMIDRAKQHRAEKSRGTGATVLRFPTRASRAQFLKCGAAQAGVILSTFALGAFGTWFFFDWVQTAITDWTWWYLAYMMVALPIAFIMIPLGWAALVQKVLGKFEEGDYPLWSWGYFKWWVKRFMMAPAHGIAGAFIGSPFAAWAYRLVGANMGKGIYIQSPLEEPNLVTIEDGASISEEVHLRTHAFEGGMLRLRKIHIGKNAFVGPQSIVSGGVRMEADAKLHPLSCMTENSVAPAGTEWRGSPAQRVTDGETELSRVLAQHERDSKPEHGWMTLKGMWKSYFYTWWYSYLFAWVVMVPMAAELVILVAAGLLITDIDKINFPLLMALALPFSTLRAFSGLLSTILGKWAISGRTKAGTFALSSKEYAKAWLTNRCMAYLVDPKGLRGFTETLFMPHVLRWMGMKVGKKSEISDTAGWQPDLVELGEGVMLADRCVIGVPIVHRGLVTYRKITIEDRSFVANAAHIPITTSNIKSGSLIGVLSIPPDEMPGASDWLGSPPMRLPNRQRWSAPDELTYNPPKRLVALRWFFNFFKVTLPGALSEMLYWGVMWACIAAIFSLKGWTLAFAMFGIAVGYEVVQMLLPVAMKWLLVGRYPKGQRYLWSTWMWRAELVYEVELMEMSVYSGLLGGTPFYATWYRLMGAKIGKQVCINGGSLMEADLVTLGDHASVEGFLQTHLFEDRVMKLGEVKIGEGCSVGAEACVLYDSQMGDQSALGDLSLIMKGESFMPNQRYRGLPAENVVEAAEPTFAASIGGERAPANDLVVLPGAEPAAARLVAVRQTLQ